MAPKPRAYISGGPKRNKHRRKGNNHAADGPPGVLGVAAAVAAFVAAAVWALGRQRQRVVTTDRTTLATLVRKPMHFTEHALCRMDCRHITHAEVSQALQQGTVNRRKSNLQLQPCPKYVVDANISLEKNIQVVAMGCAAQTNIITVIDKDTNWPCVC